VSSAPNLPDIEAALVAACTIVASVGGYNTTIPAASISLAQREIKSIARADLPALDIVFQGEEGTDQPGLRRNTATWLITAIAATTATTDTAATTQRGLLARQMRDDLKAAIYGSTTLHGVAASFVKLREYMDTTGQAADRDSSPQATARFLVDVIYYEPLGLTPPLT
jgi:hypothetical protein